MLLVSAGLTLFSHWWFYPALRCPQSPPSCEIFLTCPLSVSMSSICYMMSGILTGQGYVREDLGKTSFALIIYRDINQHVVCLICPAPSVCCTCKLNLKLICHTNGDKVYRLGLVLCNLGGKRNWTTLERARLKLFEHRSHSTVKHIATGNFPWLRFPLSEMCW